MDLLGHRPDPSRRERRVRRRAGRRSREVGRRRVGPDRRGTVARSTDRRAGGRVRLPGRLDRARLGGPDRGRHRARHPRGAPPRRRPDQRRHPHAGGDARLRADGAHLGRCRGPPHSGPPLPRLPPQPHHRRRDGVVGLARPRHRRRAGSARGLPRSAGLRGALRQAVPRRHPDLGEPLRPRHHRRGPAAGGDRRHPRPCAEHPDGRARRRRSGGRPRPGDGARRRRLGLRHPVATTRPSGRTTTAAVRRERRRAPQRDRAGRVRPGPADRAGQLRRGAVRLPRPGPARADHRPPAGTRGTARGPPRDAAGLRARATAGDGDRHPGCGPVGRRGERRARR